MKIVITGGASGGHFVPLMAVSESIVRSAYEQKLLQPKPLFFLINGYSAGYSSIAYVNNLLDLKHKNGGTIEHGEMVIREEGEGKRDLPCGIYARWSR